MIIRWRYIFCICPYNQSALKWAGVYLSWLNSWWVQMFLFLWVRSKVQIHRVALKYCLVRSSEAHLNYLLASVTMCYLPSCRGISRHHAGDKDTSVSKMRQTHLALYLVCLFLFSQEFALHQVSESEKKLRIKKHAWVFRSSEESAGQKSVCVLYAYFWNKCARGSDVTCTSECDISISMQKNSSFLNDWPESRFASMY